MTKMRIILTDDHKMFRQAIKMFLVSENLGEIVGEASNGVELLDLLKNHEADIVLLDISMPEMNGIEACRQISLLYPKVSVIALSMFGEEEYYYQMIDAGVKGFVLKSSGMYELEAAIENIKHGESYFSSELLRRIIVNIGKNPNATEITETINLLTDREMDVLKLVCNGKTNDEIAEELFISHTTVKGHRRNLLSKTNSNNTASLVMYAIKHKLIEI